LVGRDELALELAEPAWIDVEAAFSQLDRARAMLERGDARVAWALAQVPINIVSRGLLPGAHADWLDHTRRELEDLRLQALDVIGRAGLELGGNQLGSAERAARALIEAEPYRESGYVLLMRALAARGNSAEGLLVFDHLRTPLRDQLGSAPSHETIAAHEALIRPAPRPPEARARGGSATLGARRAYWDREHLQQRLTDATEMLRHARAAGDVELALQGHAWLVVDLLEKGDPGAVEIQIGAFSESAERLRQPLYLWNAAVWRAMQELLAGRLESAERLASEALRAGHHAESVTAPQYYAAQLLAIRREQGRIGELEGAARTLVHENPHRPAWRAALATLLWDTDRHEEARGEFEELSQAGYEDIPRDGDWMITIVLLAQLCSELDDAERARKL
jgi:Bacterial transcriptional activator domain